jgi:subtilisin family serine protease/outer membrane biosynthesis protein TonB
MFGKLKEFINKTRLFKNLKDRYSSLDQFTKTSATVLLLLIFYLLIVISIQKNHISFAQIISQGKGNISYSLEAQNQLGIHKLAPDEFAVIVKQTEKSTGKTQTAVIKLNSGEVYSQTIDSSTTIQVIEGSSTVTRYVNINSPNISIHNKAELTPDGKENKIDARLTKKFQTESSVPAIVEFNVSYGKFFEKGQSNSQLTDKLSKFNTIKNKMAGILLGKGKLKKDLQAVNGVSVDLTKDGLSALENSSDVKQVYYDMPIHAFLDTSTTQIGARSSWNYFDTSGNPLTGKGEKIAIIDTGVDYHQPAFGSCTAVGTPGCKVIGGYDFINNDSDPMDDMGHGTHVAATAAGKDPLVYDSASGNQLWGVAPDASILAYKVLDSNGSGAFSTVIQGIQQAVTDGVNVISMSLGADCGTYSSNCGPTDAVSQAVDSATAAGVVVVIAAGNSGPGVSTVGTPGVAQTAITVAASCKTADIGNNSYCLGPIASFSSRGPVVFNGTDYQKPDVAAPGVNICAARWDSSFPTASTCYDNNHIRISGTSMATPHVAGAAALILQAHPGSTPDQVKQLLKGSATNLGSGLTYNDQGAGQINVSATIPGSQNISANPGAWSIVSDPTKATTNSQQQFLVNTSNTNYNLSVSTQLNVSGITLSLDKTNLQISAGNPATLSATLNINNDTAKAGSYTGSVVFSDGNGVEGIIPIFVTVKPTFTITPIGTLDYGNDDPSKSNWTSNTINLQVTNLRQDKAQTIKFAPSSFASGINYQIPSSVNVPAGGNANVNTSFNVNNSVVANNYYTGTLSLQNQDGTYSNQLSTKFSKFYILTIQDPNDTMLDQTFIIVHDRNNTNYFTYNNNTNKTVSVYLNAPGLYDVIVDYPSNDGVNQLYNQYTDVKEGVFVNSGLTTLQVSLADVVNKVWVVPTDPFGAAGKTPGRKTNIYYAANPQLGLSIEEWAGSYDTSVNYYSNVSSSYIVSASLWSDVQNATMLSFYNGGFSNGLSGNLTISNNATDFKRIDLPISLDQQTGTTMPVNMIFSLGSGFALYDQSRLLTVPAWQTIYSLLPSSDYWFQQYFPTTNSDLSPFFSVDTNIERWNKWMFDTSKPTSGFYPSAENWTEFTGLGPTYWAVEFQNTSTTINMYPYYFDQNQISKPYAFSRQDYSLKSYPQISYNVLTNGQQSGTGILPAFIAGLGTAYVGNTPIASQTVTAGSNEIDLNFPYIDKGINLTGIVIASFNTSLADPNPPAFKRFYFYANNARSEVYDPNYTSRLDMEIDPVGGTISNVTSSYSLDLGVTFQPLTTNNSTGVYSVTIPNGLTPSGNILTIKINAVDNSNNTLTYTFQVPVGTAPVWNYPSPTPTPPSGSPTPTPSPIPTPTSTSTPTPTPSPIPTPTSTPIPTPTNTPTPKPTPVPTITPTPTPQVFIITGNVYIDTNKNGVKDTGEANYNGATVNLTGVSTGTTTTNTSGIYTFSNRTAGNYTVTLTIPSGYSKTTTNPVITTLGPSKTVNFGIALIPTPTPTRRPTATPTPTPVDKTAPNVSITSPTNNSFVSRNSNVVIRANATDNVGVTKVEFYVNGALTCTDTAASYTCTWRVPSRSGARYPLTAKAYDAAGNTKTSTAINVTSR